MPGDTQAWPKVAAIWSPAMPLMGSEPPRTPGSVSARRAEEGRTCGSIAMGTPTTSHSQGSQRRSVMSNSSVRLAFETSVTWLRPPVRRQARKLSTVPKHSSPASARARRPASESRMWAILGPLK